MSARHIAEPVTFWRHPAEFPPPHGTKMLLFMWPGGACIVGQWQGSGAALWAPMPSVGAEMRDRLTAEYEAKKRVFK